MTGMGDLGQEAFGLLVCIHVEIVAREAFGDGGIECFLIEIDHQILVAVLGGWE